VEGWGTANGAPIQPWDSYGDGQLNRRRYEGWQPSPDPYLLRARMAGGGVSPPSTSAAAR
jgi:hypothetical protein